MHALLVAMGSMGDTFPFLSLGQRLRRRGHDVVLAASGYFQETIESAGLEFHPTFSRDEYLDFVEAQKRWTPKEALEGMLSIMLDQMPRVFEIVDANRRADTVVVAQGLAIGARVAQEVLGVPTVTIHLQPISFRSTIDMPGVPRWIPRWIVRLFDRLVDRIIDQRLGPTVNEFRDRFGLAPCRGIIKSWWNSPDRVLGFFPEWFDAPRADWPANSKAVGFPYSPTDAVDSPREDLAAFLAGGAPPLVFSQSSVAVDEEYLTSSIDVARRLGMRAVLLSPYTEPLADPVNTDFRIVRFAPLRWLLPQAALHIHHGGIGTIAATLAAGLPQLLVPMGNDQPDNASRLARLGVCSIVDRKRYRPARVARVVARLLSSTSIRERCRSFAEVMKSEDGIEVAAAEIEQVAQERFQQRGRY